MSCLPNLLPVDEPDRPDQQLRLKAVPAQQIIKESELTLLFSHRQYDNLQAQS